MAPIPAPMAELSRSPSRRLKAIVGGRQPTGVTLARLMRAASLSGQTRPGRRGRSLNEFDRSSLQTFLAMTDLHAHALTFRQLPQPAALERCRMDENILSSSIRPYEAKPLVAIVHFN